MVGSPASRLAFRGRLLAVVIACAAATPLLIAASLTPSTSGIGTHRGLGLPACGWQSTVGLPCPTCGMTTAFSHASRADFAAAFMTQPAGLFLSILAAMAVLGGAFAAVTGSPMQRVAAVFFRPQAVWIGIGVVVLAWVLKLGSTGLVS